MTKMCQLVEKVRFKLLPILQNVDWEDKIRMKINEKNKWKLKIIIEGWTIEGELINLKGYSQWYMKWMNECTII